MKANFEIYSLTKCFLKVAFAIWTFPSFNQTLKISRVSADLSEFGK